MVISDFLSTHDFSDHFVINHHFIHFLVEYLHLIAHCLKIKVSHLLAGNIGQVRERVYEHLVVFH